MKRSAARRFTSSVLPTPVPPTKMKLTGLRLACRPTRLRFMAAQTASMASSWPTMCSRRRSPSFPRRSYSSAVMLLAGILVQSSMTRARFSRVRTGVLPLSWFISSVSCMMVVRMTARRS